ncbi:MAG: hypothetical protein ABIH83_01225 [Candidatus Micrarchaeota archaeon]
MTANDSDYLQNITNVTLNGSVCSEGALVAFVNTTNATNGSGTNSAFSTVNWTVNCTFSQGATDGPKNLTITVYNNKSENATVNITITQDTTGPTFVKHPNSTGVLQQDNWYSDWYVNVTDNENILNITINVSDAGVWNVSHINISLWNNSQGGAVHTFFGVWNMSNTSTQWNITLNLTNISFNNHTITTPEGYILYINGSDVLGNVPSGSPENQSISLLLHNLGNVQGPPADVIMNGVNISQCIRETTASTNMSKIRNYAATNFVMESEMNGTATCSAMFGMTQAAPWNNTFQKIGKVNFSLVNISSQAQAQAVMMAMGNAIQIQIAPPRSYRASRIYVNSSAISSLNTSANITLYYLPLCGVPNISYDEGGDNSVVVVANSTWYDSANYTCFTNLTIQVGNFSGYNLSDVTPPSIRILSPLNASNYSSAHISFSVNGTGSEISYIASWIVNSSGSTVSNAGFVFNGTHNLGNTSGCVNISPSWANMTCNMTNLSLPATAGNYTLYVRAYDFGGTSGNILLVNSSFVNNTGPTVSANVTYTNKTTGHTITIQATFADDNGADDINFTNVSLNLSGYTNVSCTYNSNTTSGGSFTVYYNCTNNTAFVQGRNFTLNITVNDTYNTTVNAVYAAGDGNMSLPDNAPVISAVAITPLPLFNFTNATCTPTVSDPDNDTFNYTYNWSINGSYTRNLSGNTYNTTDTMWYVSNYTAGSNITCMVIVNSTYANATAVNSTTYIVSNQTGSNMTIINNITMNVSHSLNYTTVAGDVSLNMSFVNGTNVSMPAGNNYTTEVNATEGNVFLWISNFTVSSGDLTNTNTSQYGLIFQGGPSGVNFTPNATVTFNYSGVSAALQAQIETALAAGNLWIKKCNESGGACQNLSPSGYSAASNLINVSISGFSVLGIYDNTSAPAAAATPGTTSSGSSTGGGSFSQPVPATPSAGEEEEGETTPPATPPSGGTVEQPGPGEAGGQQPGEGEQQPPTTPTTPQPGTTITPPGGAAPTTPGEEPGIDFFGILVSLVGIVILIAIVGGGAFLLLRGGKGKGLAGI